MEPQQFPFDGVGNADMIINTKIINPYKDKPLTIISGEYENLNKKVINPGDQLEVDFLVPNGFREYIKSTSIFGKPYIYIGLRNKDAADPIIHTPTL